MGQTSVVCITHGVFLFRIGKDPFHRLFPLAVQVFAFVRFPQLLYNVQIFLPDVSRHQLLAFFVCPTGKLVWATFERVQELIAKTKRWAPKPENSEKNIFSDLLYCADCGRKLWYHTNTINKYIHFFVCSNYEKEYRGTCKTRHYIRADAVEQIVKLELRQLGKCLREDEEGFAELLAQKMQKAIGRNETVLRLYEKVYEDNAAGKVTDEFFLQLSHKYEVERIELKDKISSLRKQMADMGSRELGQETFISAIRKFMQMDTLTAPLLRELIDRIDVYETEGTGKNRTQRVAIHYRFVGYIELSDSIFKRNHQADPRQGVRVNYLRSPATA